MRHRHGVKARCEGTSGAWGCSCQPRQAADNGWALPWCNTGEVLSMMHNREGVINDLMGGCYQWTGNSCVDTNNPVFAIRPTAKGKGGRREFSPFSE